MVSVTSIPRPTRLPPAEPPVPCERCGEWTIRARRVETGRVVDVRWCLDGCGAEDPPFAQRSVIRHSYSRCAWCSAQIVVLAGDRAPDTCSLACADRKAGVAFERRRTGRALRRSAS